MLVWAVFCSCLWATYVRRSNINEQKFTVTSVIQSCVSLHTTLIYVSAIKNIITDRLNWYLTLFLYHCMHVFYRQLWYHILHIISAYHYTTCDYPPPPIILKKSCYIYTVQVIKKFPLRNRNTNLLQYIYDYDTMELLSRYEEITIFLCSESTKITKCFICSWL